MWPKFKLKSKYGAVKNLSASISTMHQLLDQLHLVDFFSKLIKIFDITRSYNIVSILVKLEFRWFHSIGKKNRI